MRPLAPNVAPDAAPDAPERAAGFWRLAGTLSLKARMTLMSAGLVCAVVILVTGGLTVLHGFQSRRATQRQAESMRRALDDKVRALAGNVAVFSERAVVVNNYLFLATMLKTAVSNDADLRYGFFLGRDGTVLVHSDAAKGGSQVSEEVNRLAQARDEPWTQDGLYGEERVLEATAPINPAGERWGVVRFGLSLRRFDEQMLAARRRMQAETSFAVATGAGVAILLMLVGSFLGLWAARRINEPLTQLLRGTHLIREGDLSHRVPNLKISEFAALASAFNDMAQAVRQREKDLEAAVEAAQEANRLKSEFLANISHELRTPLNAAVNLPATLAEDFSARPLWHCGSCDLDYEPAEDSVGGGDDIQEHCPSCGSSLQLMRRVFFLGDPAEHLDLNRKSTQAARHLLAVVNDLLDFSRLEAGRVRLFLAETDAVALVDEVVGTLGEMAHQEGVTLSAEKPSTPVLIMADQVKVQQILLNLVGNAIKFTDRGGRVVVRLAASTRDDPPAVVFEVEDTGVGIPEASLEAIFDRFRQVDGSHTRRHGGAGLGLTITRKLVDLHGGTVTVRSKVGVGSTFTCTLPVAGPPIAKPVEGVVPTAVSPHAGSVIAVVDDDEMALEITERALRRAGFRTLVIQRPEAAMQRLEDGNPDALVLDVMMPEVSGLTLLRELRARQRWRDLPVIVSTAYHANRDIVRHLGGVWIPKPWSADTLLAALNECLSQRGSSVATSAAVEDSPNGPSRNK